MQHVCMQPFLGHIRPGDQADTQPEQSYCVWARPGPHNTIGALECLGHITQQVLYSVWARPGPGTKPTLSHIYLTVSGPHNTILQFYRVGPHLGQNKSYVSVCSMWTSFGPGPQPELGQNWSKDVAQRWARPIQLSSRLSHEPQLHSNKQLGAPINSTSNTHY